MNKRIISFCKCPIQNKGSKLLNNSFQTYQLQHVQEKILVFHISMRDTESNPNSCSNENLSNLFFCAQYFASEMCQIYWHQNVLHHSNIRDWIRNLTNFFNCLIKDLHWQNVSLPLHAALLYPCTELSGHQ